MTTDARIYIADLHEYNSGKLEGQWFDLDCAGGIADLLDYIEQLGDHEYAIHDHEGFYGLDPSELSMDDMTNLGQEDDETREAICAWLANTGYHKTNQDDWRDKFNDAYRGCHESYEDYVYELVNDLYNLNEMMGDLCLYFNYEAYGRDLELGGDLSTHNGEHGVHVYDNHV